MQNKTFQSFTQELPSYGKRDTYNAATRSVCITYGKSAHFKTKYILMIRS